MSGPNARLSERGRFVVRATTALTGIFMLAAGVWAMASPRSFADFVDFPAAEHFVHDVGAFQIGIGVTLLLAMIWADALAVALGGFLVGNSLHIVSHAMDLDSGGNDADLWLLVALSVIVLGALMTRLRQLGCVVGEVRAATSAAWTPFVHHKTAVLTTYRRDGTRVDTPLSIAVDGDRAFVRSYERAGKTKRIHNNPGVAIAPSTALGKPTGPALRAHARQLSGIESRNAARALHRKYPLLQGVLVPLAHRVLLRAKTGKTVHFELTPH